MCWPHGRVQAFADRAARELTATGENVRKRDGRTNPEIGAQLFLSARTVEWHLRKIYTKLGIGSRRELNAALARLGQDSQPT
jgi:DNA-binding CsgD family transcriptional regulator